MGLKWRLLAQLSANFQQIKMAKSKLRLDTRRALADNTYPIQIVVGHGTNIYIGTGIYAEEKDWNSTACLYSGKSGRRVNSALIAMLANVSSRILDLKESGMWPKLSKPQIKQMLTNLDLVKPTVGAPSLADVFKEMASGRRDRTKGIIQSTKIKIEAFAGAASNIHFEDITRAWLDDFYNSMSDMSVNTKSTYLRNLRRAFNFALDRDITTNNPFRKYHIRTEETKMRVLELDKFQLLLSIDLVGLYPMFRDIFLLTFYLIGINTVDLAALTEDSIVNGRIEYRRSKTGKLYSIKIEPEAMELINRYRGTNHLISVFDKYKDYNAFQGSINKALAKMGPSLLDANGNIVYTGNHREKMLPIDKHLSVYYARYSWATYAAELDIAKDTISESLGHSHGAKITGVYIKYNRDKVDAANRKVIDYLLGR